MDNWENERCVQLAEHMIKTKATVRSTAAAFGISKSTVHKDLTERLRLASPELYKQAKQILEETCP